MKPDVEQAHVRGNANMVAATKRGRGKPAGGSAPNAVEPRLTPQKAEILAEYDALVAAKSRGVIAPFARKWKCSEEPMRRLVAKWKAELAEEFS